MSLETEATTFREFESDGYELHYSDSATDVGVLSDEVLEQVKLLGSIDLNLERLISLGIPIDYMGELNGLPPLDPRAKQGQEAVLYPLLTTFSRFLYREKDRLFQNALPAYVRVRASGPGSVNNDLTWHCDGKVVYDERRNVFIRMYPSYRRLVVSLDTLLRDGVETNVQFVDGEFEVRNIKTVKDDAKTLDEIDIPTGTIVTGTTKSVIRINDADFAPDPSIIRSYSSGVITDLGCTTLHIAQEPTDAVRVSLQCVYDKSN